MLRRTFFCRAHVDPELSKYYHATFADGTHRVSPNPESKAWQDRKSPIRRFWQWYAQPVYKGTMLAAWCVTGLLAYYCACVADDAKSTYMVNTAIQRTLHLESIKAQEAVERYEELKRAYQAPQTDVGNKKDAKSASTSSNDVDRREARREDGTRGSVVNYELELARERQRADEVNARNKNLVMEMIKLRNDLREAVKQKQQLEEEVKKLGKLVKSLTAQ